MALNTLKCNHLTPLGLKGLNTANDSPYIFGPVQMGIIIIITIKISVRLLHAAMQLLHAATEWARRCET